MSMFEDSRYRWRETYFVLFDGKRRPALKQAVKMISDLNKRFELTNLGADDRGLADSLTVISHDDFAALDVCYTEGAEVIEQGATLIADMKKASTECRPHVSWEELSRYDARFDVLHFEQVSEEAIDESEDEEMLDPTTLLLVLGALCRLTGGVAIDPQAGTFLLDD